MVYFLWVWFNYQLYQLVEGHILHYLSDCYYVFSLDTLFANGTVWDIWRVLARVLEYFSDSSAVQCNRGYSIELPLADPTGEHRNQIVNCQNE